MIKRYWRPVLCAALASFLGMASGLVWFLFGCEMDEVLADV